MSDDFCSPNSKYLSTGIVLDFKNNLRHSFPKVSGRSRLLGFWGCRLAGDNGDSSGRIMRRPGGSSSGRWSEPGDFPMHLVLGEVRRGEGAVSG